MLRDLKSSCYLRQEQDGILVGPYEHLPTGAVHDEWGRGGPPKSWAWDLFPDDVDRLEDVLISAIDTVPALGDVGFSSVVNGPTIWAPDALPRCGRTEIPGYYDFNTLASPRPRPRRTRRTRRSSIAVGGKEPGLPP